MASTERQSDAGIGTGKGKPVITAQDIVFTCASCQGELVVDREGAGLECLCAHCGAPLVIPHQSTVQPPAEPARSLIDVPAPAANLSPPAPAPSLVVAPLVATTPALAHPRHYDFSGMALEQIARRIEELRHQLKENMSQDVEMRGHVNRATIELHRLQLRLKKLHDRQADIEAEIVAAKASLSAASA